MCKIQGVVNLRCRHRGRLLVFFVLICLVNSFHSCNWGAGSYPYSEVYMIDLSSSDELIDKINEMKLRSPQLNIHYKNENEDTVTLDEMIPNYYICRFLIDNMVYMCAINLNQQKQKTVSLRFVSICEIEEIGRGAQHWKRINTDDLTKKGNEAFKIKFEKRILNNLGVRWRRMSTM